MLITSSREQLPKASVLPPTDVAMWERELGVARDSHHFQKKLK